METASFAMAVLLSRTKPMRNMTIPSNIKWRDPSCRKIDVTSVQGLARTVAPDGAR